MFAVETVIVKIVVVALVWISHIEDIVIKCLLYIFYFIMKFREVLLIFEIIISSLYDVWDIRYTFNLDSVGIPGVSDINWQPKILNPSPFIHFTWDKLKKKLLFSIILQSYTIKFHRGSRIMTARIHGISLRFEIFLTPCMIFDRPARPFKY